MSVPSTDRSSAGQRDAGLPDNLRAVLATACAQAGLDPAGAVPIRLGENAIVGLPGGIVVRIARPRQLVAATREVQIARWLADQNVPAVQAVDGIDQPVQVQGRAVTFWRELPPHQQGSPAQVAEALRRLHHLPIPTGFSLAPLAPFVRLADRIEAATTLADDDRTWLHRHLSDLQGRYAGLPAGLPHRVVHGDAWVGNVAATADGRVIWLDLERCSIGPPEWDLINTTLRYTSFAWITADTYRDFCRRYGYDVTSWDGFTLLRDIRELRMTCYTAQRAAEDSNARAEAELRVRCLRGGHGPRPWSWTPAP
jgi:aminoglycoside phosphotransferase (APT) family kinase protein